MDKKTNNSKFTIHVFIASILLIVCAVVLVIVYNAIIRSKTIQACYSVLSDTTDEACSKIENNFENDRASLRMLSKIISKSEDMTSNEVNNQLATYTVSSYITNVAIITPDNKIIRSRHKDIDATNIIDYDKELKKGEHISGLQPSMFLDNKYVIRNYIPIRDSITAKGILFTEMNPTALSKAWKPNIYNGAATFCIIDRETGNILMSDHDIYYRNIKDMNIPITTNILHGETGYGELTLGDESIIVSYRPMNIEQWEIMFIIDDDVVLKDANDLRKCSFIFIAISSIIFISYISMVISGSVKAIRNAKRAGSIDSLTGLLNRNSYDEHCAALSKDTNNIACVYIDANGLHEINNERGHLAGDMMLRFIAETLKLELKDAKIYRIGGDEFVAFLQDRYDTGSTMADISKNIVKNGYHISYGIAINNGEPIIETIKTAETNMYTMKEQYYLSIRKPMRNKKKTND